MPLTIFGIVPRTVLQFLKPEWVGVVLEVREVIRDGRLGDWERLHDENSEISE